MRTRVVLALLLALAVAGVATALSERSTRLAGTSHVRTVGFSVTVPGGETACQPGTFVAEDAGAARMAIQTGGHPVPPVSLRFTDPDGVVVARGAVAGGRDEGELTVPFARPVQTVHEATSACVRNGGRRAIALAGDIATPASGARVEGGAPQGVVAFAYPRARSETWWPLLPGIARRFGLGKASLLGTWTLPLAALALLGTWIAVVRLLLREQP